MSAAWTKPSAWLAANGLENVHVEPTVLPYWRRGEQSATLLSPRRTPLTMLGLGGSIGTQQYGSQGLTAEVIVVSSFDELTAKAAQAKGKIVVFNQQCDWKAQPVDCYGESVSYRTQGWLAVSAVGGVASLIRSVASFSIDSPHTGSTSRSTAYPPIPTAALTVEDVAMLARMQARGQPIKINLKMEAEMVSTTAVGHNVVAELRGSEKPNEVVIVSGHIDRSVTNDSDHIHRRCFHCALPPVVHAHCLLLARLFCSV
jgi:carboxypeptidase Q